MTFDRARLGDPEFFADRRLAARSDHRWYHDAAEAAEGRSSYEQSLNGLWKFHYAKNPSQTLPGFEAPDYDATGWDDIPVPAHLQLQGYDRPQYTNVQYPWDGHEQVAPPAVPQRFNPVGSYLRRFTLDDPLAPGQRLAVSFGGAESAIAVWLNGVYVGYSCDSFTPAEFDLTDALVAGENVLAAQVFRWSAASWIEDQDFYRFSGLFREVVLLRRPAVHVEDVRVTTTVADDLTEAVVAVQLKLVGAGSVALRLAGVGALSGDDDGRFAVTIAQPRLWSPEDPFRYDLTIEVRDEHGGLTEHVPLRVGVRRFGIEDGLLRLNGQRVVFKGVNRHEFGLQGRVVTREQTEADVRLMKSVGINAVRTSHYPNNSFFYDLCDQYGLLVVDEMNLESHGGWEWVSLYGGPSDQLIPGDLPQWRAALLDRAASLFERDKNHACVVMWSLGNESAGGGCLRDVADYFRRRDSRPVHYEGVTSDPRYPETTDVASQMYTPAAKVAEYLATHPGKPFMLCEFAHAMGNSFGAVDKYLDLAYREPRFQGGFIWDFADQAIALTDRYGRDYFGYGGDCGDAPNDLDFSGNGILFADRTPKPFLSQVKYLYQGFQTVIEAERITIENRLLFTDSADFECVVRVAAEGQTVAEASLATDVPPGQTRSYPSPLPLPDRPGEYAVEVSYRLRQATSWATAGHEVGWEQAVFRVGAPARVRVEAPAPEVVHGIHNVGARGAHFQALFSRLRGGLVSYRYGMTADGGRELLRAAPQPNFWHAPTSNERGWGMPFRDGQWQLASRYARFDPDWANPVVSSDGESVTVSYRYLLPTTPQTTCTVTYQVEGSGRVAVTVSADVAESLPDLPEFGMQFVTDASLRNLAWYGEGPQECYVDRRSGARLGVHRGQVAAQLAPYLRPQESGSHTGVRWACVTDDRGAGLRFDAEVPMEFSALAWTPSEIENAGHHVELPPIQHTVIRPALQRRGVGGDDSWGAMTHREYLLAKGELTFRFGFQGMR